MATMGERIKQLRKENGMTQTALAEALGVTKGTVSTWETNCRQQEEPEEVRDRAWDSPSRAWIALGQACAGRDVA